MDNYKISGLFSFKLVENFFNHFKCTNLLKNFESPNQFKTNKTNIFNFGVIKFSPSNMDFIFYLNNKVIFWKIFLEFYKNRCFYFYNTSLVEIFQDGLKSFKKNKTKYSFELKPRFGYLAYNLNLISPLEIDVSLLKKQPILYLQTANEYGYKNNSTVVRYFLVIDQNRKLLNRFFKNPKNTF